MTANRRRARRLGQVPDDEPTLWVWLGVGALVGGIATWFLMESYKVGTTPPAPVAGLGQNRIPGGRAEGLRPEHFDQRQLQHGVRVEMEHTNDPAIAMEIAMDHLFEHPDYYDRLPVEIA